MSPRCCRAAEQQHQSPVPQRERVAAGQPAQKDLDLVLLKEPGLGRGHALIGMAATCWQAGSISRTRPATYSNRQCRAASRWSPSAPLARNEDPQNTF
jgi:hypothetical protein